MAHPHGWRSVLSENRRQALVSSQWPLPVPWASHRMTAGSKGECFKHVNALEVVDHHFTAFL